MAYGSFSPNAVPNLTPEQTQQLLLLVQQSGAQLPAAISNPSNPVAPQVPAHAPHAISSLLPNTTASLLPGHAAPPIPQSNFGPAMPATASQPSPMPSTPLAQHQQMNQPLPSASTTCVPTPMSALQILHQQKQQAQIRNSLNPASLLQHAMGNGFPNSNNANQNGGFNGNNNADSNQNNNNPNRNSIPTCDSCGGPHTWQNCPNLDPDLVAAQLVVKAQANVEREQARQRVNAVLLAKGIDPTHFGFNQRKRNTMVGSGVQLLNQDVLNTIRDRSPAMCLPQQAQSLDSVLHGAIHTVHTIAADTSPSRSSPNAPSTSPGLSTAPSSSPKDAPPANALSQEQQAALSHIINLMTGASSPHSGASQSAAEQMKAAFQNMLRSAISKGIPLHDDADSHSRSADLAPSRTQLAKRSLGLHHPPGPPRAQAVTQQLTLIPFLLKTSATRPVMENDPEVLIKPPNPHRLQPRRNLNEYQTTLCPWTSRTKS